MAIPPQVMGLPCTLYILNWHIQFCIPSMISFVGKEPLRFEDGLYVVVDPMADSILKNILYVLSDHLCNTPTFSYDVLAN